TSEPTTVTETTTKKYYYSSSSDDGLFEINKEYNLYLDLDETLDLSKYVSNLIPIDDYEWNTSNKKIVEVSDNGEIKGVGSGKTTVSAYYYSGEYYFQYIFTVNVDNEDVTAEKEFTIYVDATKDLGQFISKVAEPYDYDWSCDNKSIATVSNKGVVTGKKKGTTKINAKYHNGRYDYNYLFKITVKDSSGISANTATIADKNVWSLYMPVADGFYLEDFLTRNYGDYKWKISDESIVEFKNGKLSGKKEGKTTVTATYGTRVTTFNVNVSNKYEIVEADIKVNTSLDIKGCLNEDISKYDITSDREPVVTVGENGILTGNAAGMATVLAKGSTGKIIQIICTVSNTGATKLGSKITANGRVDVKTYTNKYDENATASVNEENKQEESSGAGNVFNDIAHRTWAVASIENMAQKGYLVGVGNGRFNPDGTTKRADFTIVLVKMAGLEGQSEDLYEDVRGNEYYADYVRTAKYNGIEGGVSENCFRPKDAITREEIFVMIYKAMKLKGIEMDTDTRILDRYTDNSYINDENREAIAALVNRGIVVGTGDELEITNYITRAQMAVLLDNIDDYFE
ncbi:MAG: S-layer homology domain-containing protein, partial [Firmicutes bacterium]|nr:S-layer homology domain-containing protein [Bacillota bacterium]